MKVNEVMAHVLGDIPFYADSGGGLTLSGGEPLTQFDFAKTILEVAHGKGIHTCVETCGHIQPENLQAVLPWVDLFLFDCKETDSTRHQTFTGVALDTILTNLNYLNEAQASIILRCPLVPGLNDQEEHLNGIAEWSRRYSCIQAIELLPYHPLGTSKLARLGLETAETANCRYAIMSIHDCQKWVGYLSRLSLIPVSCV